MTHPANEFHPIFGRDRTPEEHELIETQKRAFATLYDVVKALPPGRCRALALTHLEVSCMFATKAILETPAAPPA